MSDICLGDDLKNLTEKVIWLDSSLLKKENNFSDMKESIAKRNSDSRLLTEPNLTYFYNYTFNKNTLPVFIDAVKNTCQHNSLSGDFISSGGNRTKVYFDALKLSVDLPVSYLAVKMKRCFEGSTIQQAAKLAREEYGVSRLGDSSQDTFQGASVEGCDINNKSYAVVIYINSQYHWNMSKKMEESKNLILESRPQSCNGKALKMN
jgi:hypothetical protein